MGEPIGAAVHTNCHGVTGVFHVSESVLGVIEGIEYVRTTGPWNWAARIHPAKVETVADLVTVGKGVEP